MFVSFAEPAITVFEKDNLKINFEVDRPMDGGYEILMTAYNFSNNQTLDNFVLQAAVPKVSSCSSISILLCI